MKAADENRWLAVLILGLVQTLSASGLTAPGPASPAADAPGKLATLRFAILDKATGQPMPARIHLQDESGRAQRADPLPFWHDHFVCDGSATLRLLPGRYRFSVERGPEYSVAQGTVVLEAGSETNASVALEREVHLAEEGWWSGETHVHRAPHEAPLLMRAEDLHVAQCITWWNKANPWANLPLPGELPVKFDGDRFYHHLAGEDERDGGALLYFNLERPVDITRGTRHYPSSLVFAEEARRRPGAWLEIEKPFWWDVPLWVAHGVGESIGIAHNHMQRGGVLDNEAWGKPRARAQWPGPRGNGLWTQEIYYHLLNCGVRLPPSAGSASGVLPNPVGYNRVYVHLEGELTWEKWWNGLRAGRCFVSNGPLLRLRAGGQLPGHAFRSSTPLSLEVTGRLDSREPIGAVELVRNGQIEPLQLPGQVRFEESGWFLVRAIAEVTNTFRFASTGPWYVEIGGSPAPVRRDSARFFLEWTRERMEKIKLDAPAEQDEVLEPWRRAELFWAGKVAAASAR